MSTLSTCVMELSSDGCRGAGAGAGARPKNELIARCSVRLSGARLRDMDNRAIVGTIERAGDDWRGV